MTRDARLMSGIILITGPTIQYGGYFLLTSPSAAYAALDEWRERGDGW